MDGCISVKCKKRRRVPLDHHPDYESDPYDINIYKMTQIDRAKKIKKK
jgi:hypothetical protein